MFHTDWMSEARGKENGSENGRENIEGGSRKRARDESCNVFQVDDETPADLTQRLHGVSRTRKRRSFEDNGLPPNFNELFDVLLWTTLPMSDIDMAHYHARQSDNPAHKDGVKVASQKATKLFPLCNYHWPKVIGQRVTRWGRTFTKTGRVNKKAKAAVEQYDAHLRQQALETPHGAGILHERRTLQATAARPAAVVRRRANVVRPEPPVNAYDENNRLMRAERAEESRKRLLPAANALHGITPEAETNVEEWLNMLTDEEMKVATEAVHADVVVRKVTRWPINMGPKNAIWTASVGWSEWYPNLPEHYRQMVDRSVGLRLASPHHVQHKLGLALPVAAAARTTPRGKAPSASAASVKETSSAVIVKGFRDRAMAERKLTGDALQTAKRFSKEEVELIRDSEHKTWGEVVPFTYEWGGHKWSVDVLSIGSVISHLIEVDGEDEACRYRGVIVAMLIEQDELMFVVDYALFERNDFESITCKVEDFVGLNWLEDYVVNENFQLMDVKQKRPVSATGMTDLRRGGETDQWKVAVGEVGNDSEGSDDDNSIDEF
jgi:hypothetical protein